VTKAKIVLVAIVWLIVLGAGVSLWKLLIEPRQQSAQRQQKQEREADSVSKTQGTSKYSQEIVIGMDSFSGYAFFRSPAFQEQLAQRGIRLKIADDNANYSARGEALESGKLQMALFPADALVKVSSKRQSLPATIIAIVDETRGADAMVAYQSKYPNIDTLNSPETKFVLLADSPSETLARVVMHDFDLGRLSKNPFVFVDSADVLMNHYRQSKPSSAEVFVTWEPYVSQLLVNDQLHVMLDSSRFTGYIVDCLVVGRDYLLKNQETVEFFLESYFRTLHGFREKSALVRLVLDDAKITKQTLTEEQAVRLVDGIQWKNTQENFAHFGLRPASVVHVEDMLSRITNVLSSTGAIDDDPVDGQFNRLFFDRPLAGLQTRNFHPELNNEQVREQVTLVALDEKTWETLVPVGTLSAPELLFARGSSNLTEQSRSILDELAEKLKSWPQFYLKVRGSASNKGDAEANRALAAKRADTVVEYLLSIGMPKERIRSSEGGPSGDTRVTFQVVQAPY
jgi:outer membrane protein OmpA-like peptidoglycan-associated protein